MAQWFLCYQQSTVQYCSIFRLAWDRHHLPPPLLQSNCDLDPSHPQNYPPRSCCHPHENECSLRCASI